MTTMNKFTIVALALLVSTGCKKKEEAGEKASEAKVAANTKAADEAKPAAKEISITTKSPEARAAFIAGREPADLARFSDAAPKLREAVKLDPEFALAHLYLSFGMGGTEAEELRARALELSAKLPEAERLYISGIVAGNQSRIADSQRDLKRLLEIAPESWRAHVAAANWHQIAGESAKAKALLLRAVELNPKSPPTLNLLAYAHAELGEFKEAIAAATEQVELVPGEPNPLDTKGEIELMGGQYEAAEASFAKALAFNPKFVLAKSGVASAQLYRGDFDGGLATLAEARTTAGTPTERFGAHYDWVLAHALLNKDAQALAATKGLVASANESGFVGEAAAAFTRAQLHLHRKDAKKAAAEIAKATTALDGKKAPQWQQLVIRAVGVEVAARLGDKAAAKKAFDAFSAISEDSPLHSLARGYLAWAEGDTDKALAEFAKTEKTFQVTQGLRATADLLDSLKRNDEAKAVKEKIRKLGRRDIESILIHYSTMEDLE